MGLAFGPDHLAIAVMRRDGVGAGHASPLKYTVSVYYPAMKNVTITLDEKTASWARRYAARQGKSLSRFLGELLHKTMRESREYELAMRRYFAKPTVRLSAAEAPYPSREELHERAHLR